MRPASGLFIGSAQDALAFARRACQHLSAKGVDRVEAWTREQIAEDLPGSITSRICPHENGKGWRVLEDALQHPFWTKELEKWHQLHAVPLLGKLCRIEVLNRARRVQSVILVDRSEQDPYRGMGQRIG